MTAVGGNVGNSIRPLQRAVTDLGDTLGTRVICWATGAEDSDQVARGKVVTVT